MGAKQQGPHVRSESPGDRSYCTCTLAENQPYCDGSHKGTGALPLRVTLEEAKQVAWCGCRKSGNLPFCDGTHRNLPKDDTNT